jgi:hypothetical protein
MSALGAIVSARGAFYNALGAIISARGLFIRARGAIGDRLGLFKEGWRGDRRRSTFDHRSSKLIILQGKQLMFPLKS